LAAMNLAIRGIDFNLGKSRPTPFVRNGVPTCVRTFVLASPPFNIGD
jgi:type I restriction enzyme M protein